MCVRSTPTQHATHRASVFEWALVMTVHVIDCPWRAVQVSRVHSEVYLSGRLPLKTGVGSCDSHVETCPVAI